MLDLCAPFAFEIGLAQSIHKINPENKHMQKRRVSSFLGALDSVATVLLCLNNTNHFLPYAAQSMFIPSCYLSHIDEITV